MATYNWTNYPNTTGSGSGGGGGGGVTTMGPLDGNAPSLAGASINGTTLYMQSATPLFPGVVSSASQIFGGNKQFLGTVGVFQGTAALPGLWFDSDPTTGLFTVGSNNLGITINGAEAMRVTTTGNVGIGTQTPDFFARGYGRVLGINSSTSVAIELNSLGSNSSFIDLGFNNTRIGFIQGNPAIGQINFASNGSNTLAFSTNGANRLVVLSTGEVGIRQSLPTSALNITGEFRISGSTSGFVGWRVPAAAGGTSYTWPSADGTAGQFLTTNSGSILSWSSAQASALTGSISLVNQVRDILPYANGGTNSSAAFTSGAVIFANSTSFTQSPSNFFFRQDLGFLGLGTNNPQSPLNITVNTGSAIVSRFDGNQNTAVTIIRGNNTSGGNQATQQIQLNNNNANAYLTFTGSGYTPSGMSDIPDSLIVRTDGGGGITFAAQNATASMRFFVGGINNASERVRIVASGFMGINTVTPGAQLDVKGVVRISGSISGYIGLTVAASAGSTTFQLPVGDGTTGQFLQTNGSGVLSWGTASGGSTGSGDAWNVVITSNSYNAQINDLVFISVASVTLQATVFLPNAVGAPGRQVGVKRMDAYPFTRLVVSGTASQLIGTVGSFTVLNPRQSYIFASDGAGWQIISSQKNAIRKSFTHFLRGANGSTAIRCPYFSGTASFVYNGITYNASSSASSFGSSTAFLTTINDSTDGSRYRINENGVYNLSFIANTSTGSDNLGWVRNIASGAISITSQSVSAVLSMQGSAFGSGLFGAPWQGQLNAGDVVQVLQDGSVAGGKSNDAKSLYSKGRGLK